MKLTDLFTILNGITELSGKVAYNSFPVGKAPELPFVAYLVTSSDNFEADNKVYFKQLNVDVELYTELKDPTIEGKLEDALDQNEIVWEKYETYIDTERMYQIVYEVKIEG